MISSQLIQMSESSGEKGLLSLEEVGVVVDDNVGVICVEGMDSWSGWSWGWN